MNNIKYDQNLRYVLMSTTIYRTPLPMNGHLFEQTQKVLRYSLKTMKMSTKSNKILVIHDHIPPKSKWFHSVHFSFIHSIFFLFSMLCSLLFMYNTILRAYLTSPLAALPSSVFLLFHFLLPSFSLILQLADLAGKSNTHTCLNNTNFVHYLSELQGKYRINSKRFPQI